MPPSCGLIQRVRNLCQGLLAFRVVRPRATLPFPDARVLMGFRMFLVNVLADWLLPAQQ